LMGSYHGVFCVFISQLQPFVIDRQVTANDPDTDMNGRVTYTLESPPDDPAAAGATEVFSIDGDSGWITTVRPTDCEATRFYRFVVVATDHGGDVKLSSSVQVEVTVTDENDNPPQFSHAAYRGSVVENSSPGDVIVSMTTTDADVSLKNRLVTCYITGERLTHFMHHVQKFEVTKDHLVTSMNTHTFIYQMNINYSPDVDEVINNDLYCKY